MAMPDFDIQTLLEETFLQHGTSHACVEGEYLAFENDNPSGVFFMCSGKVRLSSTSEQGREFLFGELGPGRIIGATCLLTNSPYPYSIRVAEAGQVVKLRPKAWERHLLGNSVLNLHIIRTLALEHNILARRLKSLALYSVEKRLTLYLLKRSSLEKGNSPDQMLNLHFSREDLSSVLGTTRESVSRALGALSRSGILAVKGRTLKIISIERLSQYAES